MLGWPVDTGGPVMLAEGLWPYLTAQHDEDRERRLTRGRPTLDLRSEFAGLETAGPAGAKDSRLSLARWPGAAPFALFLSHDIDQIHDREVFRVLADINHIRRRLTKGETGNTGLALQRILRALISPKPAARDFETLVEMEGRHGFRSTYYLLHDRYWARQGSRYSFASHDIKEIARMLLDAGCELGVHGGYYRFNDAARYRESLEAVEARFGTRPCGIRNHLLRFSYPETWRAQTEAGFQYDATYGWPKALGARSGLPFPFFTYDQPNQRILDLLELPLTVMDTTLFRYLGLEGEAALEAAWKTVNQVVEVGGLVTLLWHNNFFNEPEYWDWQMVYERLLERLAALKPWCATGAEINRWWRARAAVRWEEAQSDGNGWQWTVETPQAIEGLVLRVGPAEFVSHLTVEHPEVTVERWEEAWQIKFGKLQAGARCVVRAAR